jgi:hypothetical protein
MIKGIEFIKVTSNAEIEHKTCHFERKKTDAFDLEPIPIMSSCK